MRLSRLAAATVAAAALLVPAVSVPHATAAPTSAPAAPQRAGAVTLAPLPASLQVGRRVTLRGTAPGQPTRIVLQRRTAGRWVTVASTRSRNGAYAAKVRLTDGGTTAFRAVRGQRASVVRSLAVLEWLHLADQSYLSYDAGSRRVGAPATVGGRTVAESFELYSLGAGSGAGLFVKPGGRCTRLEVWTGGNAVGEVGGSDLEGDEALSVTAASLDEDKQLVGQPTTWTTPDGSLLRRTISLAGSEVLALQVSTVDVEGNERYDAVLGGPRVLCNASSLPDVLPEDVPL